MRELFAVGVVSAFSAMPLPVQADELGPGDYGYRHMEYHSQEVEEKSGYTCCDKMGECRVTYVNLKDGTAYLDGRWCPIKRDAAIRYDVSLPDEMAMVCAGSFLDPITRCPIVYCGAVPPGT